MLFEKPQQWSLKVILKNGHLIWMLYIKNKITIYSPPEVRTTEFLLNFFLSFNTWKGPVLKPKHVVLSDD
jgi:hypothetical protein